MKNRLIKKIQKVRSGRKKIFCAFLTLGYPNLKTTERLIEEFEKEGVDIIELGFPFSDPLADGPTIQYSSEYALRRGVQMENAFHMVQNLRQKGIKVPLVFFTYSNPVLHYGWKNFVKAAKNSGFDGVIIPDLPPEEEIIFQKDCRRAGLAQIFLMAPTSDKDRVKIIGRASEGFIYYVSVRGVTGARKALPSDIAGHLRQIKRKVKKPVLIGFGVSTPHQAQTLAGISDGVIVGSAIIEKLRQSRGNADEAVRFIRQMVRAVKASGR
ncbi:MAG: tryptophan synthase subunit alpha [Candidatus Omnitrophica bacterium]|nr:tryptophan synthase subunit alpha [Candidatus Omnitrophota bacterium]